jgi:hypothetical protein
MLCGAVLLVLAVLMRKLIPRMYSGLVCSGNFEPSPKHLTVSAPHLPVFSGGEDSLNPMIRKLATMLSLNRFCSVLCLLCVRTMLRCTCEMLRGAQGCKIPFFLHEIYELH